MLAILHLLGMFVADWRCRFEAENLFLCVGPTVVCAENLNPQILVMQPANQGVRYDASDLLNRARDRRNWSNDRYVLAVL